MSFKNICLSMTAMAALMVATPANATWWTKPKHVHACGCGHNVVNCGGSTSSSSTTGGTTTTSTSGGTSVPEPGMMGLFAAGIAGVAFARRRKTT